MSWTAWSESLARRRPAVCPGPLERLVTEHLGVKQRSPLRDTFSPAWRHKRQTGPIYLAIFYPLLYSSSFGRSYSAMGDGGDIPDAGNIEPGALQGANGGLTSAARTFDKNIDLPQTALHGFLGSVPGGQLGGVRRTFARAGELGGAGATPGKGVALRVGER